MRVLRVFHGGRDPGHRSRERALCAAGLDVTLVVPTAWPDAGSEKVLSAEDFELAEIDVRRAGDVNRHTHDSQQIDRLLACLDPDLLDLQMEPFSLACRQWLRAAADRAVVAYTAQNVDKRYPPPFAQLERAAYARLHGLYPCSRQAASVARGKGFAGLIDVLPLGVDTSRQRPGGQRAEDAEIVLGLIGRLVPHKGTLDAIHVLHRVLAVRPARLVVAGAGPQANAARALVAELDLVERVTFLPWQSPAALAELYQDLHVVLVPSTATQTWVEQFGRVIVEAQAGGALVAGYASGSIPEVAGPDGILVGEHDAPGLAEALLRVLSDAIEFQRRRQSGFERASAVSWDVVAAQQIAFYERAMIHKPVRPSTLPSRQRRTAATAEFGPTATLAGGAQRPFALPVLRRDAAWTRALGRAVDLIAG